MSKKQQLYDGTALAEKGSKALELMVAWQGKP